MPPGSGSAGSDDAQTAFLSLSYPITRFVVRLNVFLSEPPATVLRGTGMARIGVAGLSSDAVAASPRSANGTAEEWADFPLIPPAWSGDGPVILL